MKNKSIHNTDGVALARNGSSSVSRILTEVAAGGVPLHVQPSDGGSFAVSAGSFSIKPGGALVSARVTIDDYGFMEILSASGATVMRVEGGLGDWRQTLNPTTWHGSASAFLPEGTYSISATVNNAHMNYPKDNLAYFRYEVLAQYTVTDEDDEDDRDDDKKEEPPICNTCGCGNDSGNNTGNGKANTPDSPDEECGGAVSPSSSPRGGGNGGASPAAAAFAEDAASASASSTFMRYDSVWHWQALVQDGVLTIRPTSGRRMTFALVSGDSVARPTALTRHHAVRVELQNADLSPCTSGTPVYWTLTEASGRRVRFETSNGTVAAVVAASGRVTTAAEHAAQVQERFADDGSLLSVYSPAKGLMLCSDGDNGSKILSWFAPAQVSVDASGNYTTSGEPYKTSTCLTTIANGVETTTVTRQQAGLPAHTETRTDDGSTVTVIKGSGEEAIIHAWENTYPEVGLMQIVETVRKGSADAAPASCSCERRKLTEGGWLTISRTEGYGTELARTTTYDYNEKFLVSRINRPDGGYAEYAYDADGRVTQEISPWGNGGKQRTRYVYNANSSRFYDNRPIKVYTDYQEAGTNSWLNIKVVDYTYEDSAAVERTTAVTHIAGTSQLQTTIEESYGEQPAYAYAAGKPKFSQDVSGVQTYHEYAATTEHGAMHKHTSITKANGALVAAQSRKTEEFIAADGTTSFEQESIWNGTEWLLLNTTAYEYDEQQRVVKTTHGNGRFSTATWMCCGRLSETNEDGITTTYGYNSAHQLVETIRSEVKDGDVIVTPETITTYTRDAAGRTLTTRRDIGAMTTTESTEYDILGRVTRQTDILGRVTTTAYSADGLTTTVTTPAGATTITLRNADGSTARISGTAQRELHYSYTRNGNNLATTVTLADGSILSQTITNGNGQTIVTATPNTLGGFIYTRSEYNAKGQLTKQYQDTGSNTATTAPTLYEYDAFGNMTKQTLALADTPTKDNSPVVEMSYSVESTDEGVFSVTTNTRYNAEGNPLVSVQKQMISDLSATLASKSISTDVRGNVSINWAEYTAPAKVTSFSSVPGSNITAEVMTVDGLTISQTDNAGITSGLEAQDITTVVDGTEQTTSLYRRYTATGMEIKQRDGRGNVNTTVTDIAGRVISSTDAAGNMTFTAYDAVHDKPAVVTNAQGFTSCYKYDSRGRKIAEWGTALQPACFGYDDRDNMVSLSTFRAGDETITTDPSERTDKDTTTWTFHPLTGAELSKTYADNTSVTKTYDAYNRLATETDARGNVKTHSYEQLRGLHIGTTYSDGTTARSYSYNHLGQPTQVTDDSGTRTFGYNTYGERISDSLSVDGDIHLITETSDNLGRSTGFVYSKNGTTQHTVTTGYGTDGRINSAGFLHGGAEKVFGYEYLIGSNLLHKLTKPNGMTLTQSYEEHRDLLTGMAYHRGTTLVAQREYVYDTLGRPTARNTARKGTVVNDSFTHNTRSELTAAQVNGEDYQYNYDNIGNRTTATESDESTTYTANALNQYTTIQENEEAAFTPLFDADGNQTRIKTETGIWEVIYNAENRPVSFTNAESNTVVECAYDSMGRRAYKKVTVDGTVTLHQRYIYRGYLQIAALDLTRSNHPALWFITWDPTQPIATRPLSIRINSTWYTYGWDLTKNICELYSTGGGIATSYTYTPFGKVTSSGSITQPIQWSSEYRDSELGMVYYNYRHYMPMKGRWINRDLVYNKNLYSYLNSRLVFKTDFLGLASTQEEINKKTYDYAIKYSIQLNDTQRIYNQKDCCSDLNWLLFASHADEAISFISGKYEDEFGSINMNHFDMIAIVSCAPDLTNSLIPDKKRLEELTNEYFPSLDVVPEHLKDDINAIKNMYIVDNETIKSLMELYGFNYDENIHGARNYYVIPDVHPEIEKTLHILLKEAKKVKNKSVTIHVRCSPDMIGMEMLSLLPESNGNIDEMVNDLSKNNMFSHLICGKTYKTLNK